jgi:fucose 4-O-acetylase-like acetyltransferase
MLAIVHGIAVFNNTRISFTERAFGNVLFFLSESFIGIAFWLVIAKVIPLSPIITLIGESTMMIFILHTFVFNLITGFAVVILRLPPTFKYESLASTIIYTSIAVALTVALMPVIQKVQPWLIGR